MTDDIADEDVPVVKTDHVEEPAADDDGSTQPEKEIEP